MGLRAGRVSPHTPPFQGGPGPPTARAALQWQAGQAGGTEGWEASEESRHNLQAVRLRLWPHHSHTFVLIRAAAGCLVILWPLPPPTLDA